MIPKRLKQQAGRHSLVDGIRFRMPVNSERTPALMAAFTVDAKEAARLMPGNEVHPVRVSRRRALLVVTVIDYQQTDIGKYIEFSIALACTHGRRRALPLLPLLLRRAYGMGQYVLDLPVSSEVSVKGGKGIWGMPKHQASLDFRVDEQEVSSQYDLDGQLAMRITLPRPRRARLPVTMGAVNYCAFRGMLMKSYVYFRGKIGFRLGRRARADLLVGDHPRMAPLRALGISAKPIFTAFFPTTRGILDDHVEAWFLSEPTPPQATGEGLESVVGLGNGEAWPPPPTAAGRAPVASVSRAAGPAGEGGAAGRKPRAVTR